MKTTFHVILTAALLLGRWSDGAPAITETESSKQGLYFAKKVYAPKPLPKLSEMREKLPAPIFAEKPEWVAMYWKAWELAFKNFHEPAPGSGYVSQFIDAAFNQNIFLWDTCFMTMFCNYGHPLVPGIGSLDNFYIKQYEDGEISREIDRRTGHDFTEWVNREGKSLFSRWGWAGGRNDPVVYTGRAAPEPVPHLTLDALNHPIMAWAELESYRITGDRERLTLVNEPLIRYYRALQKYIRQGNGLYMTDWASMDNSPRNAFLKGGGCAIDTSSQMVLFARNLATMASLVGKDEQAPQFTRDADELSRQINDLMWDPEKRFYFDLTREGKRTPVKTIAAFWTLVAGVASPEQAKDLVIELNNPKTFKRVHRVPTLAADQNGYDPAGGYWCGAVWPPTTTMVIRGLEQYGHKDLAHELAFNHLGIMGQVFKKTGTIFENYAPDSPNPGRPAKGDFVGWSGIGPIMYLLEFAIGLRPDATANTLVWNVNASGVSGCERFRFNGHMVSLKAEPVAREGKLALSVTSDGAFKLQVRHNGKLSNYDVKAGQNTFSIAAASSLYDRGNIAAWCIVPYDAKQRGPEERAHMLKELGLTKLAYDWRTKHIVMFDAEVEAMKRNGIEIAAWWYPGQMPQTLEVIKRHGIHPQLWVCGLSGANAFKSAGEQRVEDEAGRIRPIAREAAALSCKVGLYNHREPWFEDQDNQIKIIERLQGDGLTNVGIVFNFHHWRGNLETFPALLERIKPHLLAVNLNGMNADTSRYPDVNFVGTGASEARMMHLVEQSGWRGPIGIINEHEDLDAAEGLARNLVGVDRIREQLR